MSKWSLNTGVSKHTSDAATEAAETADAEPGMKGAVPDVAEVLDSIEVGLAVTEGALAVPSVLVVVLDRMTPETSSDFNGSPSSGVGVRPTAAPLPHENNICHIPEIDCSRTKQRGNIVHTEQKATIFQPLSPNERHRRYFAAAMSFQAFEAPEPVWTTLEVRVAGYVPPGHD
eukprot:gnl/TRDRNA2_/TRDRNA2_57409_c0_seq1.p2 gnl/TRDRNA2_/TRDRNA2_57409_c0~~gnl/TRDRNA2_/TRDRNA2_57409_c0_seq1.p2  ORF type:complete len:173 (+),score=24.95 gnl/TRDRNA2_/TRDRNA2_57409_c0_seq1:105-623(+)